MAAASTLYPRHADPRLAAQPTDPYEVAPDEIAAKLGIDQLPQHRDAPDDALGQDRPAGLTRCRRSRARTAPGTSCWPAWAGRG